MELEEELILYKKEAFFLLFFLVGFWLRRPCNYDNFLFFFNAHAFPSLMNFVLCVCYVFLVCLYLSMQCSITCGSMIGPP